MTVACKYRHEYVNGLKAISLLLVTVLEMFEALHITKCSDVPAETKFSAVHIPYIYTHLYNVHSIYSNKCTI